LDVGADGFDVSSTVGDEEGFEEVEEGFADYPGSGREGVEFGEDGEADVEDLEIVFEALQDQRVAKGILVALMCDIIRTLQV